MPLLQSQVEDEQLTVTAALNEALRAMVALESEVELKHCSTAQFADSGPMDLCWLPNNSNLSLLSLLQRIWWASYQILLLLILLLLGFSLKFVRYSLRLQELHNILPINGILTILAKTCAPVTKIFAGEDASDAVLVGALAVHTVCI